MPELVIQIEVANVLDDGALQEKIKKICETYKGYRLRIVVKEESASGWETPHTLSARQKC